MITPQEWQGGLHEGPAGGVSKVAVDIRDVARRSGVSVATVSRALNVRPGVAAGTRERVTAAARELGYQPNHQARALVRRRCDTVGLIWDTSYVLAGGKVPFLQDLLVGLKIALSDAGYHLMVMSPRPEQDGLHAFARAAAQHNLDGVVLMGVDENRPEVSELITSGLPVVGLDVPVRGVRASYVSTDSTAGAAAAVRHLADLGHRRIATIAGPQHLLPAVERLAGYTETMAALGCAVLPGYVLTGDFFRESGHDRMRRLLALPQPPTAVFVAGDIMAVGASRAIREAGFVVPGDVSVVGYDDLELASVVQPALSTIRQDYLAMGTAAVDLLQELIDDTSTHDGAGQAPRPPVLLPGRLVVRESTGPPRPGVGLRPLA